jgi:hypothetical protein
LARLGPEVSPKTYQDFLPLPYGESYPHLIVFIRFAHGSVRPWQENLVILFHLLAVIAIDVNPQYS